jgi:hypothetical protein
VFVFDLAPDDAVSTSGGRPARESAGVEDVPPGTVVWLEPPPPGRDPPSWYFSAPASEIDDSSPLWARIDGEVSGTYGYVEVEPDRGTFRDKDDGRRATAGCEGGVPSSPAGRRALLRG